MLVVVLVRPNLADDAQDADNLEKLRAECEKTLPAGWIAELGLVESNRPKQRGECPAVVIRTEQPVMLEFAAANAPAGEEARRVTEPAAIRLVCFRPVTQQEFARLKKQNGESQRQRSEMEARLKGAVRWGFMGPAPIPPSAFEPNSYQETRSVWEYAVLWQRTQPQELPTHHYESLSLTLSTESDMSISDKGKAREYSQVLEAVKKLLTPYDAPALADGQEGRDTNVAQKIRMPERIQHPNIDGE
jgi:hypothetical protein